MRSNQIIPLFFYMVDDAFTSMRLNGKNLRKMGKKWKEMQRKSEIDIGILLKYDLLPLNFLVILLHFSCHIILEKQGKFKKFQFISYGKKLITYSPIWLLIPIFMYCY